MKFKMKFEDLNQTTNKDFDKMIAETVWIVDRPRTWNEWFFGLFGESFDLFIAKIE